VQQVFWLAKYRLRKVVREILLSSLICSAFVVILSSWRPSSDREFPVAVFVGVVIGPVAWALYRFARFVIGY
jgi:hypothetical protein